MFTLFKMFHQELTTFSLNKINEFNKMGLSATSWIDCWIKRFDLESAESFCLFRLIYRKRHKDAVVWLFLFQRPTQSQTLFWRWGPWRLRLFLCVCVNCSSGVKGNSRACAAFLTWQGSWVRLRGIPAPLSPSKYNTL